MPEPNDGVYSSGITSAEEILSNFFSNVNKVWHRHQLYRYALMILAKADVSKCDEYLVEFDRTGTSMSQEKLDFLRKCRYVEEYLE